MNYLSEKIKLGKNFKIGHFNTIEDDIEIGDNVTLGNNIKIYSNVIIGNNVKILDGAIIGSESPDRKSEKDNNSRVIIGNNTIIREFVTVHKSSLSDGETKIGDDCLLLSYSHVSHDTIIENNVTITNSVQIGGFSTIQKGATIGGGTFIHQRTKIGSYCMVAGGLIVVKDVVPYCLLGGTPVSYKKINLVGLKRNNFTSEQITNINNCYSKLFKSGKNLTFLLNEMKDNYSNDEEKIITEFILSSKRGVYKIRN